MLAEAFAGVAATAESVYVLLLKVRVLYIECFELLGQRSRRLANSN